MSQQSNRGKLIEAYLEKHLADLNREEKPLGVKTLARMFLRDHAELFDYNETEIDNVRSTMRDYLGRHGKKKVRQRFDIRDRDTGETQPSMPESHAHSQEPFILPAGKWGVIADVHVPYHNPHAIAAACKHFQEQGVTGILINGDLIDFWKISRFIGIGQKPDTAEEIRAARQFLQWLRYQFPDMPIIYKLGNHCKRWVDYIWFKGAELAKVMEEEWGPTLGLAHFLRCEELGVKMVADNQIIYAGGLTIIHGHEWGKGVFNPVNPARGSFIRGKASILSAHNHQTSTHTESTIRKKIMGCWSMGCLCELEPAYMPLAYLRWNLGATIVTLEDDGDFQVDNFMILPDGDGYRIA